MRIELEDTEKKDAGASEDNLMEPAAREATAFKDLSGKKKAEYIWDYYKWWIIGGIAAIVLLVTFIRDYRENSKPVYLYAELLNTYLGYDRSASIYDDFVKEAGIDLTKENLTIGTETTLSDENFDSTMIAYQQRLIANYAAQTIDVVIGPKAILEGPANCDCYADLGEILPQDLIDELKDRDYEFYYFDPSKDQIEDYDETVPPYFAGIYLDNCSYLNNIGEHGAYPVAESEDERVIFTIAANSLRTDHAVEFLRFLIHNH
ncbi:MAG: hypothetical protein K6G58_09420 [Lachnospiraceae bacterium]|nr:hypothetical protein [Lachnospiraceae bacterium]